MITTDTCCPKFNPGPWDKQMLQWENKPFVKDRVHSFFHIPLDFGSVMKRNVQRIEAADAMPEDLVVLTDENSRWGADVYIAVNHDVPGASMATLSGDFLTKVFEGPYRNVPKWMREMSEFASARGKTIQKVFCYYTTCPKCARKYGKNYVVLLAQV